MTKLSKYLKILTKYIILSVIGGLTYYGIENLWRGFGNSHPYMIVVGGTAFVLIGVINNFLPWEMRLTSQMMIAGLIITTVELVSGLIFNVALGLNIWDYSNLSHNFMGQICLAYAFLWQWLSVFGILLFDYANWLLFKAQKPHYKII